MPHSAVVRIFATGQDPDYDSPWQARPPVRGTGSGVILSRGRILTGAHVVANATFIQVQRISEPSKVTATVVGICHDADLALLAVDDPDFAKGVTPAKIGGLPGRRDRVIVVGFPVGGDEVSITEGVVSRIEVQRYSHSQRFLLAVTVDAAINPGNSGGPVFRNDRVVGIAFQKLTDADGIGEMVPTPIIKNFLAGVKTCQRIEIPTLGVVTQNLENPMLRKRLGLKKADTGVLVLHVEYQSSSWGVLKEGDTILSIGGYKVANNSTVKYRNLHRTRFDACLGELRVGDKLTLQILRDGSRKTVTLDMKPGLDLVPRAQFDVVPSYFIFGGLVFQTLTRDYLATWDMWWEKAPKEFLYIYYSGHRSASKSETVILTQILADEINVGYEGLYSESVISVNGKKPRDMKHFVALVEAAKETVEIRTSSNGLVVLDVAVVAAGRQRILERYRIEHDRSLDLCPKQSANVPPKAIKPKKRSGKAARRR